MRLISLLMFVLVACANAHVHEDDALTGTIGEETDSDCDGTRDYCVIYQRDEQGNPTLRASDDNCDGVADRQCGHLTFDSNGYVSGATSDDNCDGEPDGRGCWQGTSDERGNQTSMAHDEACNGVQTHCEQTTFDADDRRTSRTGDVDCDGEPSLCIEYRYEATTDGEIIHTIQDDECEGMPFETCTVITNDAAGRKIASAYDHDCDGFPSALCSEWTYDDDGNLTHASDDTDCDGQPEACTVYTNTAARQTSGADDDCDGVADHGCSWQTFDDNGHPSSSGIFDEDCDGIADGRYCQRFESDADGNWTLVEDDTDCDGTPDSCTTLVGH